LAQDKADMIMPKIPNMLLVQKNQLIHYLDIDVRREINKALEKKID
jgi:hypothetical protein